MASDFTTGNLGETGISDDRNLISAERVHGTAVYNHDDEKLGSIDSIYLDKRGGEVAYVVMSFGGFLGIGEKYHPLPWDLLDYDTEVGGYRVDLDRDDLLDAPSYDRAALNDYDFDADTGGIDDYYTQRFQQVSPIGGGDHDHELGSKDKAAAEAGVDPDRRSDANDGVNRPLGFYSTQAQADRNGGTPGAHATDETANGPSFYSPDQQTARNGETGGDMASDRTAETRGPTTEASGSDHGTPATEQRLAAGPEGAQAVKDYEKSQAGATMPERDETTERDRF